MTASYFSTFHLEVLLLLLMDLSALIGMDGMPGMIGFKGEVGPAGLQGEEGKTGLPGKFGYAGDPGAIGQPGPRGRAGQPGKTSVPWRTHKHLGLRLTKITNRSAGQVELDREEVMGTQALQVQ